MVALPFLTSRFLSPHINRGSFFSFCCFDFESSIITSFVSSPVSSPDLASSLPLKNWPSLFRFYILVWPALFFGYRDEEVKWERGVVNEKVYTIYISWQKRKSNTSYMMPQKISFCILQLYSLQKIQPPNNIFHLNITHTSN